MEEIKFNFGAINKDEEIKETIKRKEEEEKLREEEILKALAEIKDVSFDLTRVLSEHVVTRYYRAPELILMDKDYGPAIDMWSVGCILGEMLIGRAIFPGTSTLNQIERVLELTGKPS